MVVILLLQDQMRYELPKVMCNGNDYIAKVMVMVMITFPKKCVMVMVMVMKKLQCNGNGNDYFQK